MSVQTSSYLPSDFTLFLVVTVGVLEGEAVEFIMLVFLIAVVVILLTVVVDEVKVIDIIVSEHAAGCIFITGNIDAQLSYIVIVRKLSDNDFFIIFGQNLDIKTKGLQFFDKNLKALGNAGLGNVFAVDNGFGRFLRAHDVIALDGQDLLKGVCRTVCFKCPDFHFTETLAAELCLAAERLLSDQ